MASSQTSKTVKAILSELRDDDLKAFKCSLSEDERIPKRIPYAQLEKLDRLDVSAKISQTYGAECLKHMMGVLEEIDRNDLVERFSHTVPKKIKEKKERRRGEFRGPAPSHSSALPRRPAVLLCDGCQRSVAWTRFKCTVCPDYDLCSDCQSTGLHKKHPMLAIQDPSQVPEEVDHFTGGFQSLKLQDQAPGYLHQEQETELQNTIKDKGCERQQQKKGTSATCSENKLLSVRYEFIKRISEPILHSLLDDLLDKKVITDDEMDSAMRKNLRTDKARTIIDTVRRKGNHASSIMIDMVHQLDPNLSELLWQ